MRHVSRRWGDGLRAAIEQCLSQNSLLPRVATTSSVNVPLMTEAWNRWIPLSCCNMKTQRACQEHRPHTDTNYQFFILTRVAWLPFFCLLGKACWGWLEMCHLFLSEVTFFIVQPFQTRQGSPQGWRKLRKWMDLFSVKTVTAMVP